MTPTERPDRNLAIELVRTTEAAALSAARWQGRGDKEAGDQAAVDAMRQVLATVENANRHVVEFEGRHDTQRLWDHEGLPVEERGRHVVGAVAGVANHGDEIQRLDGRIVRHRCAPQATEGQDVAEGSTLVFYYFL